MYLYELPIMCEFMYSNIVFVMNKLWELLSNLSGGILHHLGKMPAGMEYGTRKA